MTIDIDIDDKALIAGLTKASKIMDDKSRVEMLRIGGTVFQEEIQANIRRKLNKNSRDRLATAVTVRNESNNSVLIGIWGIIYAAVHEYGAVITPKRAKVLHFFVEGKEIFSKYVVIPARPYFRTGIRTGRKKAFTAMSNYLKERFGRL